MDQTSETQNQASEEQTQTTKPEKKKKVLWRSELITKTFLEACIEEVTTSGRLGSNLKPHSWIKVGENLKKVHNFEVDARQMRNRYDYLRSRYVAWCRLKSKTGNHYDPTTNTFNFTKAEWDQLRKGNKIVDTLRSTPLSFPERLPQESVDGDLALRRATGVGGWGPSSKKSRIIDLNDDINTPGTEETNSEPSLKECKEKLNSLGRGATNSLHRKALGIFCESVKYREQWMLLDADKNEHWVKMVSTKLGFDT
ncbi:hypothetical protein POM88_006787 [Heracleum sosnowskyi]|uniref:Myb/SANT-like domain-containing protein n=1 Tax=Heracleum sosnowskyi TaxID=360622 RepID=A0AAD8J3D2_9APIA|nr:hypothetical protein POM88_006787 [Heracleum sosnowskyi]